MANEHLRYYQFGEFKLDSRRRILFKNDDRIDISGKNFELLFFLIQNEGRILTHDEILDAVWHGTFVEQSNLKKGISALRQILDESPNESLYIKTIPRQGYSFVAPVIGIPEESDAVVPFVLASQTEIYIEETEEILDDPEPKALPAAKKSFSKLLIPIAGFLFLVVICFVAWKFVSRSGGGFRYANTRVEKLATDGNCFGRVSLDNNFLVCAIRDGEWGFTLELRQLATDERRRLFAAQSAEIYASQFSHDGNFVYFVLKNFADDSKSGIYKVSVLGGDTKMIVPVAGSMSVASSGTILFSRGKADGTVDILQVDPNGRNEKVIVSYPSNFRVWDFRFTPDEKSVLLSLRKQISAQKNVFYVSEVSIESGTDRVVFPERDTLIASAVWMPDMKSLLLCIRETNADIRQVWQYFVASGEMVRITNDNTSYRELQILKDGKTISSVTENVYSNIWVGSGDALEFRAVTSGVQSIDRAFWLRDGRIGYAAVENSAEMIRLMAEDGSSRSRVNEGKDGIWMQPSLGGDGNSIAYNSNRSGLDQLWRSGIDGQNPTQITRSEVPIFNGRLLSDGTAIYKASFPGEGWFLLQCLPDRSTKRLSIPFIDVWDISPDEKQIATIHANTPANEVTIAIFDRTGGEELKRIKLKPGTLVDRLVWDRDMLGFTFIATDKGVSEIYRIPIDGGEQKMISNFRSDRIFSIDWSFDGRKLVIVRGRSYRDPVLIRPTP